MLYHTFSTQEEIDREYNPRFSVENTDELIQSYLTESKRVSGEYANLSGVAYGASPEETLDIYSAGLKIEPLVKSIKKLTYEEEIDSFIKNTLEERSTFL